MMSSRAFLKRRMMIGALLAVLAVTGCGTETEPDAAAESPTAEPTAADGTDYAACVDGECEVSFSEPVEFAVDGPEGQFTVSGAIEDDNGVKVDVIRPNGHGTGAVLPLPGCSITADGNDSMSYSCVEDGEEWPEAEAGWIVVRLLGLTEDTAVIQVAMG